MKKAASSVVFAIIILLAIPIAQCQADTQSDYVIPNTIKAKNVTDFYGIWRCSYLTEGNKVYTIEWFLNEVKQNKATIELNGREYDIDELGNDYCTIIGSNSSSDAYSSEFWGPFLGEGDNCLKFENGKLVNKKVTDAVVTFELLADGNLCLSSSNDDNKQIYTRVKISSMDSDDTQKSVGKTAQSTEIKDFTINAYTTGMFGKWVVLNRNTDQSYAFIQHLVPAGCYHVTNTDKRSTIQITVYKNETEKTADG